MERASPIRRRVDDEAARPAALGSLPVSPFRTRRIAVLAAALAAAGGLLWRAAVLQTEQKEFLHDQGVARHLRVVKIAAHRGAVTDRSGQALAISTPIDSVWANPGQLAAERGQWSRLTELLGVDVERLHQLLADRIDREFVYLRRHVPPDVADAVRELAVRGVYLEREYRRYYPAGEVAAHVVGFTDIDDRGQEGMELAFEEWLGGSDGAKQVIQDRLGRIVDDVENVEKARPGHDLALSIDLRVQSLAYRALKQAVTRNGARGGSAVVLDAPTGEVLAMVSQPSYNPNNRAERTGGAARNRAMTDVFEPGSTVKAFTIAAALEARTLSADTAVDTNPGFLRVGRHVIRDPRNFGIIDVGEVIKRSSNVGASRIALATPPDALWRTFAGVGFGALTGTAFPGESAGILARAARWGELERATLAFGYGLSVTPLQLAQAYAVLANAGRYVPATLQRAERPPDPRRARVVMSAPVASRVLRMLEAVVGPRGTGARARVAGYRIAGKTGTARKSTRGGYAENRYNAVFAGIAPASAPRLVMVVVIDEPAGEEYYGGQVAAPVFAEVVAGTLRLLGIAPDDRQAIANHVDLTTATSAPPVRPFYTASSPLRRTGASPGDRRG